MFTIPRESVAERLKVMASTPGATITIHNNKLLSIVGESRAVAKSRALAAAEIIGVMLDIAECNGVITIDVVRI